ncbi:hypothetical protein [Photorhabdus khanii]|uniref:Uncharacterized protein n=1 Tax=Photorhabdus khanii subsp. guanajuatensis TaxID=2100166 RepID=A0A4R4JRY2_9GAMM|nr:hypothetical protein [Photorhabdus khanii]TDB57223.1 hypothetical protein C5467_11280 [Photorhabdus khanii subsp. guanajuatensis]
MNEVIEILKHYSPAISVITFIAGLYVGNKQAIGRDKRKEFNALAEPIIESFDIMLRWLELRSFTSAHVLPNQKIQQLMRRLSKCDKRKFERLIDNYHSAITPLRNDHSRENEHEKLFSAAISVIKDIKKFLKLR